MRVASLNLPFWMSVGPAAATDPDRLARAVRALDADVLALQEVDHRQPRSGSLDVTAAVADAMGARHARFEPALHGIPGGAWSAADGSAVAGPAYGVALVSRHPVTEWHVVRLRAARVRWPVRLPDRRVVWLDDEPRVGLVARLDTPRGPVTVATTHLSFVPGWSGVQLRRLVGELARVPGPRLLLGDLNMPGRLPAWLSRWEPLVRQRTFPAHRPRLQLDHALASGVLPGPVSTAVRALPVSDHAALVLGLGVPALPG